MTWDLCTLFAEPLCGRGSERQGHSRGLHKLQIPQKGFSPLRRLLHNTWVPGERARCSEPAVGRGTSSRRRDFAHWRNRFGGGLFSSARSQCTNPHPNGVRSVQSRPRREAQCTNPRPIVAPSVQSRPSREALTSDLSPCQVLIERAVQITAYFRNSAGKSAGRIFRQPKISH